MPYPRLMPSDLEVARSIAGSLPHPEATISLCFVVDALGDARRHRGTARQALPLDTPVSLSVIESLQHPMANTALKEISQAGFPTLAERLRNEWITELALADQSDTPRDGDTPHEESSTDPQTTSAQRFLTQLQRRQLNVTPAPHALLPSDRDVVNALIPQLDQQAQTTLQDFLSQLDQLAQERRDSGMARQTQRLTDPDMQASLRHSHEALSDTLSPVTQLGFPRLAERLINEYALEIRTLSQAHLNTPGPGTQQLAEVLASRYAFG